MRRVLLLLAALAAAPEAFAGATFAQSVYTYTANQSPKLIRILNGGGSGSPRLYVLSATYNPLYQPHPIDFGGQPYVDIDISNDFSWQSWLPLHPNFDLQISDPATPSTFPHAQLHIQPDTLAPAHLSIDDVSMYEGTLGPGGNLIDPTVTFTVELTTPALIPFSVPLTLHDLTATRNVDYTLLSGLSVSFSPGDLEKQVKVKILSDAIPEGDEMFTIELGTPPPGANVVLGKSTGTCTIIDDDGAVGPDILRIAHDSSSNFAINLGSAAPSPETIAIITANPAIATIPASVTLPTGESSITVPVIAKSNGSTLVSVVLPPSRGGRTYYVSVIVFDPALLSFDRDSVQLTTGDSATIHATLDPAPAIPIVVTLKASNAAIADIPSSVTIDASGSATFAVRARTAGFTSVTGTLPDLNGGLSAGFRVDVAASTATTLTSLGKASGRTTGGDTIAINGTNFSGRCIVTFGDVPAADAVVTNATTISAVSPPHDAGAVDVSVRCGTSSARLANGFTYNAAPIKITQVTPSNGSASGGTLVRVTGENLRPGVCTATIGGAAAKAVQFNGTFDLTVVAPAHAAGPANVALRCGSDSLTLPAAFLYLDADDVPAAISFSNVATAAPGDRVTIGGAHFRPSDTILVNGVPALDVTNDQNDSRTFTVPELPAGTAAIALRDALGREAAGPSLTVISRAVAITDISPPGVGGEIRVTGSGLRNALSFVVGGVMLDKVSVTSSAAVLRLPRSIAAGSAQLSVVDGATTVATRPFTINASLPVANAIAPPCSSMEGGALATITGSNFVPGMIVQFGTTFATETTVRNDKTIDVKVPPSFGAFHPAITIWSADNRGTTLTNAFSYGDCGSRRRAAVH